MGNQTFDIAALYSRYRETMYAVAYSTLKGTGCRDQVDDVVMDTVVSLMHHPPQESVRNWEAFLVRATRNKALDLLKSAHVRHTGGPLDDASAEQAGQDLAEEVAEGLDRERVATGLWDRLTMLEERERKILWDHKALERPRGEIAREHRITPSRVSQISTHALMKLRAEFAKEGIDECLSIEMTGWSS